MDLDNESFNKCFNFCMMFENQDMLRQMQASIYPKLKKDARSKFHKDTYKRSYPDFFNESQAKPTAALKGFLKAING